MNNPVMIWESAPRNGAMQNAYFRREFSISKTVKSAQISLFADSWYHLYINGSFIGFGPARSYPEFPEYDTYDIARHLRKGRNVIAVHVCYMGRPSFIHQPVSPVFTASGKIVQAGAKAIPLDSLSGWTCAASRGYDSSAPSFSFAQPPVKIFDERRDIRGWNGIKCPTGKWHKPTVVNNDPRKTRLLPRSIPHLTNEEYLPLCILSAHTDSGAEKIESFYISAPFNPEQGVMFTGHGFACSWIYSPKAQKVTLGTYWGDYFINGKKLRQQAIKKGQLARNDASASLKKGWNFFFCTCGLAHNHWQMHLAYPADAGTVFYASKNRKDKNSFLVSKAIDDPALLEILTSNTPATEKKIAQYLPLLKPHKRSDLPVSATKGMAWFNDGDPLDRTVNAVGNITIPAGKACSFVLDMGQHVLGRPFIELDAPAGTVVDTGYTEDLNINGRPNHFKMCLVESADRHITCAGESLVQTIHPRGLRYMQIVIRGHKKPVRIKKAGVYSQVYPYTQDGNFSCSDPVFTRLWEYGRNTLRVCSEDVLTDCPWRERTLYGGDMLAEGAALFATTKDRCLLRRCIRIFVHSQNEQTGWMQSMAPMDRSRAPLMEYPLLVLLALEWFVRISGDLKFAKECYPAFNLLMEKLPSYKDKTGVYSFESTFIDWTKITKSGKLACINALIAQTFQSWAALLDKLGKKQQAEDSRKEAAKTRKALNKTFWNNSKGAYRDSTDTADKGNFHAISSIWPLLFDCCTSRQKRQALEHIKAEVQTIDPHQGREKQVISPYGAFYLLGALYESSEEEQAEESIRTIYSMMIEQDTGTVWENCNDDNSLAHAWSSAPTYYMSTRALGVRLGFPDNTNLDEVLIAPQTCSLSWAKGIVPHPRGSVSVSWRIVGDTLELDYCVPKGINVRIQPQGKLAELNLISRKVKNI